LSAREKRGKRVPVDPNLGREKKKRKRKACGQLGGTVPYQALEKL